MDDKRTDREKLELFVERAQELYGRRIWREGGLGYKYRLDSENGETFEQPDEELFRSYIMDFRFFVLEKESTGFLKVHGLAGRYLKDELAEQKDVLRRIKKRWKHYMNVGDAKVGRVGSDPYKPADVLNQFLHGKYFHTDKEHQVALQDYIGSMEPLVYMLLLDTIGSLSGLVFGLSNFIQDGFEKSWFDFSDGKNT